jgi:WYL domain
MTPLKWGVERRLSFIEFRLYWEGGVNRSDIIERFGVSVPQASKDLTQYQDLAPANARYDKSARRYVAGDGFAPVFLDPDPDVYLAQLRQRAEGLVAEADSWLMVPPATDVALTPRRAVDGPVLRSMLSAVRDRTARDVLYQSMNAARPDPVWRRVAPHAFGHDGLRWHVRGWCDDTGRFKDFLLSRILQVGSVTPAGMLGEADAMWNRTHDLSIVPHPALSPAQAAVVAQDYGMTDGRIVLTVRRAMLFYVLRRLGLLEDARAKDPRVQHIVAEDPIATARALAEATS